jgi:aryl carrier-like protein
LIAQNGDQNLDFWSSTLKDYQVVQLPKLPAQSSSAEVFVQSRTLAIKPATIVEQCKSLEATFQSVALLAWGKVLFTLVGRRDVVFGHVVAGRSLPMDSAESIIGPLFNTVPFRLRLDQGLQTNAAAVQMIQQFTAASQNHQHASLRSIQSGWRKQTGSSESALFDTLFVFQKVDDSDEPEMEQLWKPLDTEGVAVQAEYGINLEIEQGQKGVVISAASQGEYLSEEGLVLLLQNLEDTMAEILNNPDRSVLAHPNQLRALPVISAAGPATEEEKEEDRTPFTTKEEIIRTVMAEVAGVPIEQITRKASIYSFGLDSIAAITLASKCRRKGINIGVADILQGGSIAGIHARVLATKLPANAVDKTPLVSPETRKKALEILQLDESRVEDVMPVLAGQLHHLEGWLQSGRTSYEPTWSYISKERLDIDRLRNAWRALRERHAVLRTAFAATSSVTAVQVVLNSTSINDASFTFAQSSSSFDADAKSTVKEIVATPSSMFTPPVRMHVLRCEDKDAVFLTLHHTTYDGWSMPLLFSDLNALYTGTSLPPTPSFSEFVTSTLRSASQSASKEYWTRSLASAEKTLVPTANTSAFHLARNAIPNFSSLTNTESTVFGLYQTARSANFENLGQLCAPTLNITPFSVAHTASLSSSAAAQAIRVDLAERVPFEQDFLRDIAAPEFNVFVNLLWHTGEMLPNPEQEAFLEHVVLGLPSDFAAEEQSGKTAVDALEIGAKNGRVYVDVGPSMEGGSGIDFGVKSESAWSQKEAEEFVKMVSKDVEDAVKALEKE